MPNLNQKKIDDKKSYQEQKERNYQKLEDELQSSGEWTKKLRLNNAL